MTIHPSVDAVWTVPADSPDAVARLRAAEARARELGLTRLFLDTRHDLVEARALYAAHGFVEVARLARRGGSRTTGSRSTT
jgi:hypothetical protein